MLLHSAYAYRGTMKRSLPVSAGLIDQGTP